MERYPNRAQVSLSDETLAEVQQLAQLDALASSRQPSESATLRKLVEFALAVIRQQQQPAQMNGAQQHHQEEHHGVDLRTDARREMGAEPSRAAAGAR